MKVEELIALLRAEAPDGEVDPARAARAVMLAHLRVVEGDKLAALRTLAQQAEGGLLREAMEAGGWNLAHAAAWLGQPSKSSVQYAIAQRHPELEAERKQKGPPDGRPRNGSVNRGE